VTAEELSGDAASADVESIVPPLVRRRRRPVGRPWLAALFAWAWPGLGHLYLRRWGRGVAFAVLVLVMVGMGAALGGHRWHFEGHPVNDLDAAMAALFTVASWGLGGPWVVLTVTGYTGDVTARGFEYGTTFLATAALMNLMLIFDAWDISLGRKR
jgi:hypothetical protein